MSVKRSTLFLLAGLMVLVLQSRACNSTSTIELQSYNFPDYYIGTTGRSAAFIQRRANPEHWRMVTPGLCNIPGTVSFQLHVSPGVTRYLRHRGFLLYADPEVNTALYKNDACFYPRTDKWFPGHVAFESVNFPGRYIRHQGYRLKLHSYATQTLFEKDASFRILEPICNRIQSKNFPNHYFGLTGNAAYIKTTPGQWVAVYPGLAGHIGSVSFRSCDDATKFLRHLGFQIFEDGYTNAQIYI